MICSCPAAIGNLSSISCVENLSTAAKLIFQRVRSASGTANSFTISSNNPNLAATWDTVQTASDDTHATVLPTYLHNVEWSGGEARQYGGGDETYGGNPITLGEEPFQMSAELLQVPQKLITELKPYRCEPNMGVFVITENGTIVGLTDDLDSPTIFKPIPIFGLHISSKMWGKRSTPDKNMISFQVNEDYSDFLYEVTPSDFDALIDLDE